MELPVRVRMESRHCYIRWRVIWRRKLHRQKVSKLGKACRRTLDIRYPFPTGQILLDSASKRMVRYPIPRLARALPGAATTEESVLKARHHPLYQRADFLRQLFQAAVLHYSDMTMQAWTREHCAEFGYRSVLQYHLSSSGRVGTHHTHFSARRMWRNSWIAREIFGRISVRIRSKRAVLESIEQICYSIKNT